MGYAGYSPSTSVINIELKVLLRSLQMAITHRLTPLQIQMDAQEVITMINNNNSLNSPILLDCRFLIQQLSSPQLRHTYREQNIVPDKLAYFGMELEGTTITFFADPPHFIWQDLLHDKHGYGKIRRVTKSNTFCMDSTHSFGTHTEAPSTSFTPVRAAILQDAGQKSSTSSILQHSSSSSFNYPCNVQWHNTAANSSPRLFVSMPTGKNSL